MAEYIEASKTAFDAYKKGNATVSRDYRMWESKVCPAIAESCWVVQGSTASTLSCLLSTAPDLSKIRDLCSELTQDVSVSVPGGWRRDTAPPFGAEFPASISYRESGGAHGEIWIARAASGEYELHFQSVTAETSARPAANTGASSPPDDDDPIGGGGFIQGPGAKR